MPDVRNCKRCGKIFNYLGGSPICLVCKQLDEDDYRRVKQYLYDYPGATMSQISSDLDVSVEKIKRFLKEGRLEIIGDESNLVLECESCGKAIRTGRFCNECERDLARGLQETASRMNSSTSSSSKKSEFKYLHKDTKE